MATLSLKSLAILFLLIANALGGPTPAPSASPATSSKPVRISFLPPPLEGTISLGIYDAKGKLVRVLHREAELEAFEAGQDALLTSWDGTSDAGEKMPPGKYHARGFVVGDVKIEGVGFFFNDWVTDEQSPRIRRISRLWHQDGRLIVEAEVAGSEGVRLSCDDEGTIVGPYSDFLPTAASTGVQLPASVNAIASSAGKEGSIWVIDRAETGSPETDVKQFSARGDLIRRLKIEANDPQPIGIAASKQADRIFLLEENEAMQRVRALTLLVSGEADGQAVSNWNVEFEKKITAHKDFRVADGNPVLTGGSTPHEKTTVKLRANPLENDASSTIDLAVGYDPTGSLLKTADGLPLQSISETKNLTRVVLSPRPDKSLDVFQDDTAVVEQFRLTNLGDMMAFDCGDFDLK
jgi:hypothetical protein